jgi:peptidoglycan hydrolase-like protein with peptidoglycan-binding domain
LKTQTNPLIPNASNQNSSAKLFARDLELSIQGEDVRALQKFLNSKGFTIATQGAGSMGNETMYFGPATRQALIKFQLANNITPATGYFGPLTKAKVLEGGDR